ncbi:hypothetical protein HY948_00875 [Candidatus Gottesmanbacteria bacterium]|nr:hypothetical protein [Candidatus Gottesmanbacteria bacterium]
MDQIIGCPVCRVTVRPADYFCFNCGKKLRVLPLGVTTGDQMKLYIGSVFLAPMGIVWGLRYLQEDGQKTKIAGIIAMSLSVITIIIVTQFAVRVVNSVNSEISTQLQGIW